MLAEDGADLLVHGHAGASLGALVGRLEPDGDREGEVAGVAEADVDVLGVDPGRRGQLGRVAGEVHLGGRPVAGCVISTLRRSTPSAVPISLRTASLAAKRAASEAAPPVA